MHKAIYLFLLILVAIRVVTFKYDSPEDVPVRIRGRVTQDTVIYDNKRQVVVHGIRTYLDLYPEIIYGDYVILEGEIKDGVLTSPKLVEIKSGGGLYDVREHILTIFKKALPAPHSALLSGIVLGSKADMPQDFWEKLKLTGTAHVVVASGMNVTFITSFILNFLVNFINRKKAIGVALSGAWIYVFLSGFDAPLVRAAIMGSIAFGAQSAGRISTSLRALFLSAGIMLVVKPEWFYDLGFILSFTATLSLILFEGKISTLLSKVPFVFKKDLATTIAAQIGVTPILFISFGTINLFSPLINALILWTIPPLMIIGGMAAVVGLVIPFLGELIVMLALPFSYWFIFIINLFSG